MFINNQYTGILISKKELKVIQSIFSACVDIPRHYFTFTDILTETALN